MKPRLTGLYFKWMGAATLQRVVSAFSCAEHPIYFVGGCVRDSLLAKDVNDIDLATPIDPDLIIETLKCAGIYYTEVGRAFGTIVAVIDGDHYQITSFRRDVETDGRWATVVYTDDLTQDAARRDFTINALYMTPTGDVYDPEGGIDNLECGRLAFIGDAASRIREDYLRILRFYRFYAYYGRMEPEPGLLQACADHAHHLKQISAERVLSELIKLLQAPHPYAALDYLHQGKILEQFLHVTINQAACQRLPDLEKQMNVILVPLLRLKIIFGQQTRWLERKLKFSRQYQNYLKRLDAFDDYISKDIHEWLYREGPELTRDYLCLQALQQNTIVDQVKWQQTNHWFQPKFPLSGHDAIAVGFINKDISISLATVEQWWIDQHFEPDHNSCLNYLKSLALND